MTKFGLWQDVMYGTDYAPATAASQFAHGNYCIRGFKSAKMDIANKDCLVRPILGRRKMGATMFIAK
jgi:hypothetical protein